MVITLIVCFAAASLLIGLSYFLLARRARHKLIKLVAFGVLLAALPAVGLAGYLMYCVASGTFFTPQDVRIGHIDYVRRYSAAANYKAVMHWAVIPLNRYQLALSAHPSGQVDMPFAAITTGQALLESNGILATNASFFRPFRDNHLFDYYPHRYDPVSVVGYSYFDGQELGLPVDHWPILAGDHDGRVLMVDHHSQLNQRSLAFAVAGHSWLLRAGEVRAEDSSRRYPRLAAGLDPSGQLLYLVAVDGKQPGYSEGMDLFSLATELKHAGVYDAIELDGGGSVTMAVKQNQRVRLLNRPAHTKIPRRQRPVANHLLVVSKAGEIY